MVAKAGMAETKCSYKQSKGGSSVLLCFEPCDLRVDLWVLLDQPELRPVELVPLSGRPAICQRVALLGAGAVS